MTVDQATGYVYIVLASQEYISAAQMVIGSYILGLSIRSVIAILLISAIVGLLAIWLITNKLNVIVSGIQQFKAGNLKARIMLGCVHHAHIYPAFDEPAH